MTKDRAAKIAELNRMAESVGHDPQGRASYYREAAVLEEAERDDRPPPHPDIEIDEWRWEKWKTIALLCLALAIILYLGFWRNP